MYRAPTIGFSGGDHEGFLVRSGSVSQPGGVVGLGEVEVDAWHGEADESGGMAAGSEEASEDGVSGSARTSSGAVGSVMPAA